MTETRLVTRFCIKLLRALNKMRVAQAARLLRPACRRGACATESISIRVSTRFVRRSKSFCAGTRKYHQPCQFSEVSQLFHIPASFDQLPDLCLVHVLGRHLAEFFFQLFIGERVVAAAMKGIDALLKTAPILGKDFRCALISYHAGISFHGYS